MWFSTAMLNCLRPKGRYSTKKRGLLVRDLKDLLVNLGSCRGRYRSSPNLNFLLKFPGRSSSWSSIQRWKNHAMHQHSALANLQHLLSNIQKSHKHPVHAPKQPCSKRIAPAKWRRHILPESIAFGSPEGPLSSKNKFRKGVTIKELSCHWTTGILSRAAHRYPSEPSALKPSPRCPKVVLSDLEGSYWTHPNTSAFQWFRDLQTAIHSNSDPSL